MLESKIESESVNAAKKIGWFAVKLGRDGHPDRMFIKNSNAVFIEFKTEKGIVSKKQKKMFELYAKHGFIVRVCRSVSDVLKVLYYA